MSVKFISIVLDTGGVCTDTFSNSLHIGGVGADILSNCADRWIVNLHVCWDSIRVCADACKVCWNIGSYCTDTLHLWLDALSVIRYVHHICKITPIDYLYAHHIWINETIVSLYHRRVRADTLKKSAYGFRIGLKDWWNCSRVCANSLWIDPEVGWNSSRV